MSKNMYGKVAGVVFAVVAAVHLWRAIGGWDVMLGSWAMPMWLSWAAIVFAGWLAWTGWRK